MLYLSAGSITIPFSFSHRDIVKEFLKREDWKKAMKTSCEGITPFHRLIEKMPGNGNISQCCVVNWGIQLHLFVNTP